MLPSAYVVLDKLPVTAHGKVDRAALPAPEATRPELEGGYVAPQSELARSIAAVWQEVLRVDRVGAQDNFFELGGNSSSSFRCTRNCALRSSAKSRSSPSLNTRPWTPWPAT